ncbi:MAG: copper amine oxidase N-terminal domain-containing protein, partial [Armatimonadota bacterium]|nr:copper amine oxidase N-terminal domain-containing protein [Armatimonadota bacterium]
MKIRSFKTGQACKIAGLVTVALAGSGLQNAAQAAIQVQLNGQPLATSVPPVSMRGRTVVPMRDIFEALGANVQWNAVSQGIIATRSGTRVNLQINNRAAMVNGRRVTLDQPAVLWRGRTMVPLRFVSEALGANVDWNSAMQLVSIDTGGRVGRGTGGSAVAGYRTISVPSGAVVPVKMDTTISSGTATVGQTFMATVVSEKLGDSEFPANSKVEGVVVEARRKDGDQPGVLDFDFRAVVLPDGTRVPLRGELTSLDSNSVNTTNGRIVAKKKSSSGDKIKIIGIGAGLGVVLGKVLKKNT